MNLCTDPGERSYLPLKFYLFRLDQKLMQFTNQESHLFLLSFHILLETK